MTESNYYQYKLVCSSPATEVQKLLTRIREHPASIHVKISTLYESLHIYDTPPVSKQQRIYRQILALESIIIILEITLKRQLKLRALSKTKMPDLNKPQKLVDTPTRLVHNIL